LGVKQLAVDPWDNLDEKLPINTELKANIVKLISKGVLVDVEIDGNVVEGFVPLSHLAIPGLKKAGMAFEIGEELSLKIIELDLENRRLILSVKAYYFAKDNADLQAYIDLHQKRVQDKTNKRRAIKENLIETPVDSKEEKPSTEVVETEEVVPAATEVEEKVEEVVEEKAEEPVEPEVIEEVVEAEIKTEEIPAEPVEESATVPEEEKAEEKTKTPEEVVESEEKTE